jgi:hypothetical protein
MHIEPASIGSAVLITCQADLYEHCAAVSAKGRAVMAAKTVYTLAVHLANSMQIDDLPRKTLYTLSDLWATMGPQQVLKKVAPQKEMTLVYTWRHKVNFKISLCNYIYIPQLYYFDPL